ncbi:MAG: 16S rRNA (guanine(966)-N(2))-methyltransferase RsmD [Flavobacteriales bacterium]|nr:16S rRNA (guanine(966)-N(2))-methyltransferase RsmD [Flavobacteriales bacterium]
MRIIGGRLKGRKISTSSKFKGRPTTDFGRESLFNILRNRVDLTEMHVLDLFSGTGAMSLEAASHGALSVTSVEMNRPSAMSIRKNMNDLGIENGMVVTGDVFKFIKKAPRQYDLIIADPPFALERLPKLPEFIQKTNLLAPDGLFVLEHGPEHHFDEAEGFEEERRYGHVHFSFFTFEEE